jgi:hypothetical protein
VLIKDHILKVFEGQSEVDELRAFEGQSKAMSSSIYKSIWSTIWSTWTAKWVSLNTWMILLTKSIKGVSTMGICLSLNSPFLFKVVCKGNESIEKIIGRNIGIAIGKSQGISGHVLTDI